MSDDEVFLSLAELGYGFCTELQESLPASTKYESCNNRDED